MRRRLRLEILIPALLLGAGLASPAWSTSLTPVNLLQMIDGADRIVVVRAVDEWTGRDEHDIPATITTFEVSRSLKGGPIQTLRIKQFGVTEVQPDGLASWVEGMPRYLRGGEYLLLLRDDSPLGFTSPMGLMQGAFEVRPSGDGRKVALNGAGNANLLINLDQRDLERLGLTTDRFPFAGRKRGGIHFDELVAMIDHLQTSR